MYPKDARIRNISMSQLPHISQEGGNVSPTTWPTGAMSSSYFANHLAHRHRAVPPQANFGAEALLELSDSVRESLAKQGHFGPNADVMSFFMELAVLEETDGVPTLDFQTIKLARLDKLVADLTQCGEMPFTLAPRFVHDTVTAEKLERMWRERLKYDYLMVDEIRANDLTMKWRLKEGMPVDRDAAPGSAMGNKPEPINSPRNITTFKPGGWKLLRYNERRNRTTGECHLEVDLEKLPEQPEMSELMKTPRPSHLDDWDLYKRVKVQITLETEYRNHKNQSREGRTPLDKP
ncbi:hypothetical protein CHGG_05696 [Chaetomium globosum CBS 148.51]|uniref:Uncharacterized protein n=1 Tax=Chaetomium globosum (strain ATCC 6205 / CBS 148.51 / DSM 1962 / NBRC 6347 / NRRL 1970) TaxID=306901 RepID=Q2H6L9_CHAGB|nr:uncharacterized protein CHGG_05696 [Chaetomium globosum CBS 148.51]EAQ89077.1 hypothetical protein CHGG_05696 [Chaetomium globosum CBS 148.51]